MSAAVSIVAGWIFARVLRKRTAHWKPGVAQRLQALWNHAGRTDELAPWLKRTLTLALAFTLLGILIHPLFVLFSTWPWMRLRQDARTREEAIARELPSDLEMLSVMIESGQDVVHAMQNLCSRSGTGEVRKIFRWLLADLSLGKTRGEAFDELRSRSGNEALDELSTCLLNAETHGTPLSAPLRTLAARLQVRRFNQAERRAQRVPFWMLLPLMGLIFPVTMILLMAPLVLAFGQM